MDNRNLTLHSSNLDAIIFDFDGVLTDNYVYVDSNGNESVRCSRSDGLAFDVLRKLKIKTFILSTEINSVVSARADKLKVKVIQAQTNKLESLYELSKQHNFKLDRTLYVGNDVNDYYAMKSCGYSICPSDSHEMIKAISDTILSAKGGQGVARELVEKYFELDTFSILYKGQNES